MKKNFLKTISVGLLLSVTVTGCGLIGSAGSKEKSDIKFDIPTIEALRAESKITLNFGHAMGAANQGYISSYIASFNEIYPNIEITQVPYSGYPALETAVTQALIAGGDSIPDIVQAYPDHLAGYMKADKVVPLDTFISSKDASVALKGEYAEDDFVENYMDELAALPLKGKFGLPFNKSSEMFVYNETVLKEVGATIPAQNAWTWDDVINAAKKIKASPKYSGSEYVPFMYDSQANAAITFGQQWGGTYTVNSGISLEEHVKFNSDAKFKEGIQYYLDQSKAGYFSIPMYHNESYASTNFITQKVFMYVGSTAGATYGVPADGSFVPNIAAVPQKTGGVKQVIQQGTNVSLLYKSSKDEATNKTYDMKRLASWLFIRHMTNKENTIDWATRTGYLPVRKSAISSSVYQEFISKTDMSKITYYTAAANKVAAMQTDYMYFSCVFPGSSKIRTEIDGAFNSIILGGKSVDEGFEQAYTNIKNV